ncbi:MAG: glycosyltransferase [Lachnospiraceae bacterium]|nr:glycosyltransferase [Candidatus Colinaster scatohippi]
MLDRIKHLIKAPRISQLNRRYKQELDRQYVSYDSWIRQKELEYLAGTLPNTNDVQVIEYCDVMKEKPAADVVLYTLDRHKLSMRALHAVISVFNEYPETMVVYGDEDEYNSNRTIRMNPIYRPDWSPDTLRNYFYMGNVVALKKDIIPTDAADIYELVIKATEGMNSAQVRHVDYVLYHNDYSKSLYVNDGRFDYINDDLGMVSIVIPSKDNPDILKQLLVSMVKLTTGVPFEIIVIDNGSNDENKIKIKSVIDETNGKNEYLKDAKYIYEPQEFNFSRICNRGVASANGRFVLLLNDDMEIRDSKWLLKMTKYASREHVGAVGAKLYYPDSKMIQHCGITNLRLGPVHKLQYKPDDHIYYDHVNDIDRNVLGVTGACLMMRKELYDSIGGLDEEFKVAFNDVDLCYSLYEAGYHNVVVNSTHLWHYESLSRGDDESKEKLNRLKGERIRLYEKHPDLYGKDPYYHDYLTSDILDSNYTYAYEYEYENSSLTKVSKPKKIGYTIKPEWENQCLIISLEQCGSLEYWLGPREAGVGDGSTIYIGGYSFVAGSDNACFDFKILLKGQSGIYELECNKLYRPDLEINLDTDENAVLCGFSLKPDTKAMPDGDYQVGVIARGLASRLVLCRFTNRYINIKNN